MSTAGKVFLPVIQLDQKPEDESGAIVEPASATITADPKLHETKLQSTEQG